jgi:signal transduction histidine kinase/ligand-binding sensor domain-containing protein/DNA-binding response OmpR family regulator
MHFIPHKLKTGLMIIILSAFSYGISAQKPVFNFKNLSTRDGLSSNDVRAVFEDSNGFMWFATSDGLNRWDGYKFVIFRNYNNDENSLPNNFLLCLAEDSSRNIWVGTNHGGLARYDTREEKFYRYTMVAGDETTVPGLVVRCIYIDNSDNVWIGTHSGMAKYIREKDSFRQYRFPLSDENALVDIRAIFGSGPNELIIESDQGFFRFDLKTEVIQPADFYAPGLDKELFRQNNPVCFDSKGFLWIGSRTGLFKLNLKTGEYKNYRPNTAGTRSINSNNYSVIFEDSRKNIWVGTENRGVNLYNSETDEFTSFTAGSRKSSSISNNIISNIYEDSVSNVWFSTLEGGVSYFSYNNNQFEYFVNDPSDPGSVSSNKTGAFFQDDKGTIWIGAEDGGLNKFIEHEGRFERYQLKTDYIAPSILSIAQKDSDHLLLSGLRIGLYDFNTRTGQFSNLVDKSLLEKLQPLSHITDLGSDSNGYIWIITHGKEGIIVYNPKTGKFFNSAEPGPFKKELLEIPYTVKMLEDSKNRIWIVSYLGLYMYDKSLHEFLSESRDEKSISSNYLYTIFEDSRKDIWIGSSKGLDRMTETDRGITFERYSEEYSLPENVKGILEDAEGNLWLSSNRGITKFDPLTKKIRDFRINNELENQEIAERVCFKSSDGEMFFGGTNGFIKFIPESLNEMSLPANVHIVDFQIFNTSQKPGKNSVLKQSIIYTRWIKLNYRQSVLSFEYAALDNRRHGTIEYAFKLDGFDDSWNFVGDKRFATYTSLSPGEYTFHVKTAVGNQLSSFPGASVSVKVLPPVWRTDLAYIIYFILIVTVLYFFRRSIINRERLRSELQMEKNEINTIREANMMKLRFFTNISHEFRTPLTLIKAPIEKLLESNDQMKQEERLYIFKLIQNNTNKLLRMVNQLLDYRKLETGSLVLEPSEGDIVDFCRKVWSVFSIMAEQKKINYIFQTSVDSLIMSFDSDKTDKIITNLLSNAFKYTHEGGSIKLSVEKFSGTVNPEIDSSQYVRICVSDTGIGIPENETAKIFDRFYTVTRKGFEKFEGTGIGLTLARELTELHYGKISVKSKEHEGSEFEVLLPVIIAPVIAKPDPEPERDKSVFSGEEIDRIIDGKPFSDKKNGIKKRVLVVEDDKDLRIFIRNELSDAYEVVEASNGKEGLQMALMYNPDLVLSDIMMPLMDGVEFCKKLKSDERTSHLPVILLSALHSQEKQIEGLALGADDYIFKPFNVTILKSKITNILNARYELSRRFSSSTSLQYENEIANDSDRMLIQSIIDIVLENITNEKINAEFIAKKILISRSVIYIKVEALTGQSVNEFIRNIRLKKSTTLLTKKDFNITEVAYAVGFSSQSYFTRCFTKKFGKSPKEFALSLHQK